ncbi:MAG: sigma 54-interacting transcriptional regulator [Candidatus Latescibacterota bacterium]|jgi:DNA-binding NtrC family response regulator
MAISQPDLTDPLPRCPASLIGRDREWAALIARCQHALAGDGGLFLVSGEAGIGKTALVRAVGAWATSRGFQVLHGSYILHPLAPPLDGLRQAIGQIFDLDPLLTQDEVETRVSDALASTWPGLQLHRPLLVQFLVPVGTDEGSQDAAGPEQRTRLCHVLANLLGTAAQTKPLLVSLEDLHWADPLSLEILSYLAPLLHHQRVLLLATCRPEETGAPTGPFAALRSQEQVQALVLSRLDLADVTRMILASGHGDDPAFCEQLYLRSEGVPFFIEQWLRACRDDLGAASVPPFSHLPAGVAQLLERRLARLSENELLVARALAVVGEVFETKTVSCVCGQPRQSLLPVLANLEDVRGLIRPTGDGGFAFSHNLLRQALYDAMPAALRQDLHRRLGELLEPTVELHPERVPVVAHHYLAGQLQSRTAGMLLRAAQQACALQAYESARGYLREAQAIPTDSVQITAQIEELLGDVARALGDTNEARSRWEAALSIQDDSTRASGLCFKIGRTCHDDLREQRRWYRQSLHRAPPDSPERAQALLYLAWNPEPEARDEDERQAQVARQMAQALRILRHRPKHPLFLRLLSTRLPYLRDRRSTNLPRVRRLLRRAIRLAEAQEYWPAVIHTYMNLASTYRGVDLAAAVCHTEEALRLARQYYPPGHPDISLGQVMLWRWRHALGEGGIERPDLDILSADSYEMHNYSLLAWRQHPRAAWDEHIRQLHLCLKPWCAAEIGKILTRLQRLAAETDQQSAFDELLHQLMHDHPRVMLEAGPTVLALTAGTAMPSIPDSATDRRGLIDLQWRDDSRASDYQRLPEDRVEITPAPEVGLGWLNCAPCLLTTADGDFLLEARLEEDSPPRRAGGLIVFQDRKIFLRLASGVDHAGQVSLCWHDGVQLRYVGTVYLPHRGVHLSLSRVGIHCEARFSFDGETWYTCGALDFGHPGPVEAGLFAECNYEHDFPQPFPVRFSDLALWTGRAPASTSLPQSKHNHYPLPTPERWYGMVGRSPSFRAFCTRLEQVARSPLTVLLYGETGAGKELAARAVHQLSGRRGPFVPVNVAALPVALIESELFGHRKGAFTGATGDREGFYQLASHGTLFLDEIGEFPLEAQAALHRALDSGEVQRLGGGAPEQVDVRCVVATSRDLGRAMEEGTFRKDLYFRLGQPLEVPPLRRRRDDIPLLVAALLAQDSRPQACGITRAAMDCLQAHDWPGNVRELQNVVNRALAAAADGIIDPPHLSLDPVRRPTSPARRSPVQPTAEELTRQLEEYGHNVAALSRHLGVNRRTLYRWLSRCGLSPRDPRP